MSLVEIKARARNVTYLHQVASQLSDSDGEILKQEDTFFKCENGRLKLRVFKNIDDSAQLISYQRADSLGPKCSKYQVAYITNPGELKIVLGKSMGIIGVVRKTRRLYIVGQTRVHVDEVEGLGDFMELEVVMRPGQSSEDGQKIANDLMDKFGVQQDDLIRGAYMDMILQTDGKTN